MTDGEMSREEAIQEIISLGKKLRDYPNHSFDCDLNFNRGLFCTCGNSTIWETIWRLSEVIQELEKQYESR